MKQSLWQYLVWDKKQMNEAKRKTTNKNTKMFTNEMRKNCMIEDNMTQHVIHQYEHSVKGENNSIEPVKGKYAENKCL